jgi:hypothetical protein
MRLAVCSPYPRQKFIEPVDWVSHIIDQMWTVQFASEFDPEFNDLAAEVQDELLAQLKVVRQFGPAAKRPRVDTLNGSKHANMKELRFDAGDGGLPSHSIPSVRQLCWSQGISPELAARIDSTKY